MLSRWIFAHGAPASANRAPTRADLLRRCAVPRRRNPRTHRLAQKRSGRRLDRSRRHYGDDDPADAARELHGFIVK
jgi:hypothetical protein